MTIEEAKDWIDKLIKTMKQETSGNFPEPPYKDEVYEALNMCIKFLKTKPCEDMGEVSDGYHTFNQLYHQRAVLFATIVNLNKDKAWKSFKHSDGKYCFDRNGEWFIVGVDTPQGSYTYHYDKKYWDMFDCKELQCCKEWDGHTEEDVTRLLSLEQEPCEDAISRQAVDEIKELMTDTNGDTVYAVRMSDIRQLSSVNPQPKTGHWIWELEDWNKWICSECGWSKRTDVHVRLGYDFCPSCGARMIDTQERSEE